jgi:hypothetical protein
MLDHLMAKYLALLCVGALVESNNFDNAATSNIS